MMSIPSGIRKGAVAVLALLILGVLASRCQVQAGFRPARRGIIMPLDNGSSQQNLPGNIATLPLFLRNGGFAGFGSGAFGQLQQSPPAGGVIVPDSSNLGNGGGGVGGKLGGLNGISGGY